MTESDLRPRLESDDKLKISTRLSEDSEQLDCITSNEGSQKHSRKEHLHEESDIVTNSESERRHQTLDER